MRSTGYSCHILVKLELPRQIILNNQISNFKKIRPLDSVDYILFVCSEIRPVLVCLVY